MTVVGTGFLARHLRGTVSRYPAVVLYAAGPSSGNADSPAEFARDRSRLEATVARCRTERRLLVYLSTASVGLYGFQRDDSREAGPAVPVSPYGRHKLAMERVVTASGVEHIILRLANPVGNAQPRHQLVPTLIRHVRAGHATVRRGARRDLIDVADVATILDRLLAASVRNEVINVASGFAVPVEALVTHIEQRLGARVRRRFLDGPPEQAVDVRKLHRLAPEVRQLGFTPGYHRTVLDRNLGTPAAVR